MKINSTKLNLALARECVSMKELAEKSGVDVVTLARINKGKQTPRPQTIGKIAKALNCDVAELL